MVRQHPTSTRLETSIVLTPTTREHTEQLCGYVLPYIIENTVPTLQAGLPMDYEVNPGGGSSNFIEY